MGTTLDRLAELSPEQRTEFVASLGPRQRRVLDRVATSRGGRLRHDYRPLGGAAELHAFEGAEVLISGPAGTGKSRAALERIHDLMSNYPGARALIVRKTLASLGSTALTTWRRFVVNDEMANSTVDFYGGSPQEPPQYRYQNGSTVVIGGMDKSTKIMSSEYDVIFVQEAIELTVDDWESLTTRLRNGVIPFQQLMGDTNPAAETHWLYQRCERGACHLIESRHEDNPTLVNPDGSYTKRGAEYMKVLDSLTGVLHMRLRLGLWVAAEGIIYDGWDPKLHLVDRFEIPFDWPRYWSVDFGYTNPFVMQWWTLDPDDQLIMYREIYRSQRLVEDHAKVALAQVTDAKGVWIEPKPMSIVADHDAEGRATLEKHLGLSTRAAKKDVSEGIQAVQSRLRVRDEGGPGLVIMRDSLCEPEDPALIESKKPTHTAAEVASYVWEKSVAGKEEKEVPHKEDDHGMDTLRYVVAEKDLRGRYRTRFMG